MSKIRFCMCLGTCLLLTSCLDRGASSLGRVFAGPAELGLHQDISPKSKVVVRVRHGDKLEIVQQRRRLYKLRAPNGAEGWTDERNLMSVEQMQALATLKERARRLPSQGVASTYETLNVHTEPQRYAPSFFQIREGEKFEVVAHQSAPRTEPARRVLVKPQPKTDGKEKKTRAPARRVPPPPAPTAPKPPDDWEELSKEREPPPPKQPQKSNDDEDAPEPAPQDDWTLVRTPRGVAGWVLTNRIYLAIPDEVAQYAEGRRITTYFSVGSIHDSELNAEKTFWLWTTIHAGQHPYDFDSFRVFTWNPRRHRYETAYIQRSIEGYLPVLIEKPSDQTMFSVCLAEDDGTRLRKRYVLIDRQVKAVDVQPCASPSTASSVTSIPTPAAPPEKPDTIRDKLKARAAEVKKKVLGR